METFGQVVDGVRRPAPSVRRGQETRAERGEVVAAKNNVFTIEMQSRSCDVRDAIKDD